MLHGFTKRIKNQRPSRLQVGFHIFFRDGAKIRILNPVFSQFCVNDLVNGGIPGLVQKDAIRDKVMRRQRVFFQSIESDRLYERNIPLIDEFYEEGNIRIKMREAWSLVPPNETICFAEVL